MTKNDHPSPQVLRYNDLVPFLQDTLNYRSQVNPRYSLRAWSAELGWKEPTSLSLILKRKRKLPLELLPRLRKSLKISGTEASYLRSLAYLQQAKNADERERWVRNADRIRRRGSLNVQEISSFEQWADPRLTAVRLAAGLQGSKKDVHWLSKRLRGKLTVDEARAMVSLLVRSGRLREDEKSDRWTMVEEHLWSKVDMPSTAIRRFHRQSLEAAIASIEEQSLDEREFASYMLNVNLDKIPAMKKRIRDFAKDFVSEFAVSEDSDAIYQINLNLFSRTT